MVPARIERQRVPKGCKRALALPQHSRKTSRRCPLGCLSAFEPTKGPGAPDRTTAMEDENPALDAGSRCANRFDAILFRQGHARAVRAFFDLHGPLLCRPLEALGLHRAVVGS